MMEVHRPVVVIGGGQAAGRAVEAMRSAGDSRAILVITEEASAPYERPPLSKGVLTGESSPDATYLHSDWWYRSNNVELWCKKRVSRIVRQSRQVHTTDGEVVTYESLLIASGAKPKKPRLPGIERSGVVCLRNMDDSLAIRDGLRGGARVALLGGGYIGLEVAAAARKMGCATTVLEAGDGLMRRQLAPEIGDWYQRLHEAHGVTVMTEVSVTEIFGGDSVRGVRLADGRDIEADLVVIGVGIAPATELAEEAGLAVADGIVVDSQGRSSDPRIFAAGDVTCQPNPYVDQRVRLESWQNAQNQGMVAGRAMAGDAQAIHCDVPWFWSDQYGINLQMLGLPQDWAQLVWRGNPTAGPGFTAFFLGESGGVMGVNAIDRPGDVAPARRMIERDLAPAPEALADLDMPLKKILKCVQ